MPTTPRRPTPSPSAVRPAGQARGTPAQLAPAAGAASRAPAPHVQAALQVSRRAGAGPPAAGALQARLAPTAPVLQPMKKSQRQRKHERKLKSAAAEPFAGMTGFVMTGAKVFPCFYIEMFDDGNISANFSQPYPTPEQLTEGTICTISTVRGTYQGHLFQVDRHPTGAFVRGNFDNVKVK